MGSLGNPWTFGLIACPQSAKRQCGRPESHMGHKNQSISVCICRLTTMKIMRFDPTPNITGKAECRQGQPIGSIHKDQFLGSFPHESLEDSRSWGTFSNLRSVKKPPLSNLWSRLQDPVLHGLQDGTKHASGTIRSRCLGILWVRRTNRVSVKRGAGPLVLFHPIMKGISNNIHPRNPTWNCMLFLRSANSMNLWHGL